MNGALVDLVVRTSPGLEKSEEFNTLLFSLLHVAVPTFNGQHKCRAIASTQWFSIYEVQLSRPLLLEESQRLNDAKGNGVLVDYYVGVWSST